VGVATGDSNVSLFAVLFYQVRLYSDFFEHSTTLATAFMAGMSGSPQERKPRKAEKNWKFHTHPANGD